MLIFNFFADLKLVKYVPEWMPGAGFQKKAREIRERSQRVLNFQVSDARVIFRCVQYLTSIMV